MFLILLTSFLFNLFKKTLYQNKVKALPNYTFDNYTLSIFQYMLDYDIPEKDRFAYLQAINIYNIQLQPVYTEDDFFKIYFEYLYKNYFNRIQKRIFNLYQITDINLLSLNQKKLLIAILEIRFIIVEKKREYNRQTGRNQRAYQKLKQKQIEQYGSREKFLAHERKYRKELREHGENKEHAKKKARMRWAKFESKFTPEQLKYNDLQTQKRSRVKRYIELSDKRKYSTLTNAEEQRFQFLFKLFKFKLPQISMYIPQHVRLKEYKPLERKDSMANLVKKSMKILQRKIALGTAREETNKLQSFNSIIYDKLQHNNDTTIITINNNYTPLSANMKAMFSLTNEQQQKYQNISIDPLYTSYNNDYKQITNTVQIDSYKAIQTKTSADEFIQRFKQQEQLKVQDNKISILQQKKQDIILSNKDIKVLDIDITLRTFYDWADIYQVKLLTSCDLFHKISEYEWAWSLQHDVNFIPLNMTNNLGIDFSQKELRLDLINLDIIRNANDEEKEILKTMYIETEFIKKQLKKET